MVLPNAEFLVAAAQDVDPLEARVQVLEAKVKELEEAIKGLVAVPHAAKTSKTAKTEG